MNENLRQIITHNLDCYLRVYLDKLPVETREIAVTHYNKDIDRIIEYCASDFIDIPDTILSEDFIKGLHKSLYPEGYIQKSKGSNGGEFVWMVPGEYKKITIIAKENGGKDSYEKVENVESSMKVLLKKFNSKIHTNLSEKEKRDKLLYFALDFVSIHPFGDGNGRLDGILVDLLCLKFGIPPLFLLKLYKEHKANFIQTLALSRKNRDLRYMYGFIEKYSE
ncbi:MAG: Fic family protein [Candidatus Gracilibacteria bacterium]|nr:Fic family protein [Candidatus Gracilibacteria bacterium]